MLFLTNTDLIFKNSFKKLYHIYTDIHVKIKKLYYTLLYIFVSLQDEVTFLHSSNIVRTYTTVHSPNEIYTYSASTC